MLRHPYSLSLFLVVALLFLLKGALPTPSIFGRHHWTMIVIGGLAIILGGSWLVSALRSQAAPARNAITGMMSGTERVTRADDPFLFYAFVASNAILAGIGVFMVVRAVLSP